MKLFIQKNIERILWIALLVFVILFFKKCSGSDEKYSELKAENKQLEKEKKAVTDSITAILTKHSRDSADLAGRAELAVIEKNEADSKVKQQQRTIDRLVAVIRSTPEIPDSSFVLVSPDFKQACDSLPAEYEKLKVQLAEKDTAINQWTDILAYEVQQRDSTIQELSVQIGKMGELNTRQSKIVEAALAASRPRGRFLIGGGNLFLPGDPFNPHIAGAYQTKGGKQYQGKTGIVNGRQYYEGTILITLIK